MIYSALTIAVVLTLSAPLVTAAAVVTAVVAVKLLQYGLATVVRRHSGRIRELSVPGIGTVRFKLQHK